MNMNVLLFVIHAKLGCRVKTLKIASFSETQNIEAHIKLVHFLHTFLG